MTTVTILALILAGCGDKDDGGTDSGATNDGGTTADGGTTGGGAEFSDYINVTDVHVGDVGSCCELAGLSGDLCWDGDTWIEQSINPGAQTDVALVGSIADFESGNAVGDATLDLWFKNDPTSGAPDYSVVSETDGTVSSTFKTCQPVAYKVSTDPELDTTVDTYETNQIEGWSDGISTVDTEFNSVSSSTYAIIPSLLGVSPDADKGTIAGTASDCGSDPIEGAQVVVRNPDTGAIPESLVVKYFVDSFPNRNQPYTSPDGLWVAINVPEGTWDIEMYVSDGAGGHVMVGKTQAVVFAESIMISNAYVGFGDGIRYPDSCTL